MKIHFNNLTIPFSYKYFISLTTSYLYNLDDGIK